MENNRTMKNKKTAVSMEYFVGGNMDGYPCVWKATPNRPTLIAQFGSENTDEKEDCTNAETFCQQMNESGAITINRYYLMGDTPVGDFEEGGLPNLLAAMKERGRLDGALFTLEEHTSISEAFDTMDGWGAVIELFPKQFKEISDLEDQLTEIPA